MLHFIIFADDTNIFYLNDDPDTLVNVVNEELSKLNTWFKINKLSLNVSKSNFMIFGNKVIWPKPVLLNNIPLSQVTVTKFLGVHIDSRFKWDKQISIVKRKLYNVIGIINRIKEKVDSITLITLYNTLMLPHLSYCCGYGVTHFVVD